MSDTPPIEVSAVALELLELLSFASPAVPEETRRPLHALFDAAIALRRRGVLSTDEFDRIHDVVATKHNGAPIPFPRVGDSLPLQPSPLSAIQPTGPTSDNEILNAVPLDGDPYCTDVLEAIVLEDLLPDDSPPSDEILDAVDVQANLDDLDVMDALAVEVLEEQPQRNGVDRVGKEKLDEGSGGVDELIPGLANVPDPDE